MSRLAGLSAAQWQWFNAPNWTAYPSDLAATLEAGYKTKDKKAKKVKVDNERFVDLSLPIVTLKKQISVDIPDAEYVGLQRRYDDETKRRAVRRTVPLLLKGHSAHVALADKTEAEEAAELLKDYGCAVRNKRIKFVLTSAKDADAFASDIATALKDGTPVINLQYLLDLVAQGTFIDYETVAKYAFSDASGGVHLSISDLDLPIDTKKTKELEEKKPAAKGKAAANAKKEEEERKKKEEEERKRKDEEDEKRNKEKEEEEEELERKKAEEKKKKEEEAERKKKEAEAKKKEAEEKKKEAEEKKRKEAEEKERKKKEAEEKKMKDEEERSRKEVEEKKKKEGEEKKKKEAEDKKKKTVAAKKPEDSSSDTNEIFLGKPLPKPAETKKTPAAAAVPTKAAAKKHAKDEDSSEDTTEFVLSIPKKNDPPSTAKTVAKAAVQMTAPTQVYPAHDDDEEDEKGADKEADEEYNTTQPTQIMSPPKDEKPVKKGSFNFAFPTVPDEGEAEEDKMDVEKAEGDREDEKEPPRHLPAKRKRNQVEAEDDNSLDDLASNLFKRPKLDKTASTEATSAKSTATSSVSNTRGRKTIDSVSDIYGSSSASSVASKQSKFPPKSGAKIGGSLQVDPTLFSLKFDKVTGSSFDGHLEWLSGRAPSPVKGRIDGKVITFQEVDAVLEVFYRGTYDEATNELSGTYGQSESQRRGTFKIQF